MAVSVVVGFQLEARTQNTEPNNPKPNDTEHKIQNPELGTRNSELGTQKRELRTHIETPPVPWTRTVSPPFKGTGPWKAFHAVTAAHLLPFCVSFSPPCIKQRRDITYGRVEASSYVKCSGILTRDFKFPQHQQNKKANL